MDYSSTVIDPTIMVGSLCIILILLVTFDCNIFFILPVFALMLVIWVNVKKYLRTNNMIKFIKKMLRTIKRDLKKFLSFKIEHLYNKNENINTNKIDNELYKSLLCNNIDDNYNDNDKNHQLIFI